MKCFTRGNKRLPIRVIAALAFGLFSLSFIIWPSQIYEGIYSCVMYHDFPRDRGNSWDVLRSDINYGFYHFSYGAVKDISSSIIIIKKNKYNINNNIYKIENMQINMINSSIKIVSCRRVAEVHNFADGWRRLDRLKQAPDCCISHH